MTMNFRIAAAGLFAAGVSLTSAAWAQSDTTQVDPAPALDEGLSLGDTDDTALGAPYTKTVNGDWELRCLRTEVPEDDPCQMYQLLEDGEGAPVAEVSLFRLPPGGQAIAGGTIVVPLETALQQQLRISVDGGEPRRYPFAFCNPVGCYVRVGLTEIDVDAFRRGSMAQITVVPAAAPNQTVELSLSLNGFTATFDEVSVIDPPAQ